MEKWILAYLLGIGLLGILLTIWDKRCAIHHRWRISESCLMTVGLLGAALPMLVTMRLIRHKTRHKKFMTGLPMELFIHAVLLVLYLIWKGVS